MHTCAAWRVSNANDARHAPQRLVPFMATKMYPNSVTISTVLYKQKVTQRMHRITRRSGKLLPCASFEYLSKTCGRQVRERTGTGTGLMVRKGAIHLPMTHHRRC